MRTVQALYPMFKACLKTAIQRLKRHKMLKIAAFAEAAKI
jgi:hypothetical protein